MSFDRVRAVIGKNSADRATATLPNRVRQGPAQERHADAVKHAATDSIAASALDASRYASAGAVRGDLSRIPVRQTTAARMQTKLKVSAPGDKYEQEANLVAESILRMSQTSLNESEADNRAGPGGDIQNSLPVANGAAGGVNDGDARSNVTAVLGGQSAPLPPETRQFMEPRFVRDFSHVRVHTGPDASASARSVSARAYTVGSHIVFGEGEYPARDMRLLAHELTHTIQQSNNSAQSAGIRSDRAAAIPISLGTNAPIQRVEAEQEQSLDDQYLEKLAEILRVHHDESRTSEFAEPTDAEGHSAALDYVMDSLEQLVYGDYTDKVTALGTFAQIATGIIGIDLPADIRDLSANIYNWEWSWGHAGTTAINAIGIIPIIGVIKNADEVCQLLKHSDDVALESKSVANTIATKGKKSSQHQKNEIRLSTAESWGRQETLMKHFSDHGADFRASTADEYAQMASKFLQDAHGRGLPTKIGPDGAIRIYDPGTNTFGSFNADGKTRTFYKPNPAKHEYLTNLDYWNDQRGGAPWTP